MNSKDLAIKVEKLSKRYRIGMKEQIHDSLFSAFVDFVKSPVTNYRKYRSLYKFDDSGPDSDPAGQKGAGDIIWALRNVSFEVAKGEVIGIIGHNGAGKSTILKILSRITSPTLGRAEIRGRISSLLEVGTGFHQELTGRENVYLNGTILGMKKRELDARFDRIVEFSGIGQYIDTPVKRYSSGMLVRLAFSVAAHLEPEILIVDEVLAVGDAAFQKKCLNKMQDVGSEGRTVLFVSHNMQAVTRLCNRAILLDAGRIVADGPSAEIVKAYLNSETGTLAEKIWQDPATAPRGEVGRLKAVRILDANNRVSETVDIHRPVAIDMEFEVLRPGSFLMPYHHLYNEEGIMLFSAHDTDPSWQQRPRPAGHYRSTAWIPGNLLSEGTVYVNSGLLDLDANVPQFYERTVVAFQVVEKTEGASARGGFAGNMGGIVRPLLDWTTEFSSNGSGRSKTKTGNLQIKHQDGRIRPDA